MNGLSKQVKNYLDCECLIKNFLTNLEFNFKNILFNDCIKGTKMINKLRY